MATICELALARLPVGKTARVIALTAQDETRRRLMDLGFVPGTRVEILRRSPAGDPTAYLVRGAVIALRAIDANNILVDSEMTDWGAGQ